MMSLSCNIDIADVEIVHVISKLHGINHVISILHDLDLFDIRGPHS